MTTSTRFDTALESAWLEFRTGLADLLVDGGVVAGVKSGELLLG